jgi:sugar phosphate isomerase/epimerase
MKLFSNSLRFMAAGLACACLTAFASAQVGVGPSFKGPAGLQLYSLRGEFARNVPATLEKVRGYGIQHVELAGTYHLSPEKFKELLEANGLNPVSAHFSFDRLRDDIENVAREARTLGVKFVGVAWIPHSGEFDEKQCREAIAVFNRAGEALSRDGLKVFYHPHGYEFRPHGNGTLLDLMMEETNPKFVSFQMDVYWVVHPGHDPVKLLEKYGSRWELMHVKDMKKGVKTGETTGRSDVNNNVVLGTGQMDWPAILKAAEQAGVKYYFIEDESVSAGEQIPQSLRYLEQLKW